MTAIKYQAVYAKSDREAARHYRARFGRRKAHENAYGSKHEGEITEAERVDLLSRKVVSEARQTLPSARA